MTARIRSLAFAMLLVLAAACTRTEGDRSQAAPEASAMTAVDRTVAVARGVRADPSAADSILAAHGLTRSTFDSLLYEVASDSALAREYAEAMR